MSTPVAILDVDGTLVDTNYHHAIAWYRAFRAHGFVVQLWRIHRSIGMGGDQLVASLIGKEADVLKGRKITSWPSLRTDIRNAGGTVVDEEVVVDGNLVSSRNPDDLPVFCTTVVETFAG